MNEWMNESTNQPMNESEWTYLIKGSMWQYRHYVNELDCRSKKIWNYIFIKLFGSYKYRIY